MPQEPLHARMAAKVSIPSISFFLVKSQTVSRMRIRGSPMEVTRSRVSSSDLPTLTTTSSQTASTDLMAGMIGKSSLTAFRTMVKPESMSGPELEIVEATIQAVSRIKLRVSPALHNPAFLQYDDLVRVLDRRQAMGDDQHGAVLHQVVDGVLHEALRLGIELAGGLVQNEDGRVPQHRPGDGDPLALAPGQPRPALAEDGVVSLGEP